MKRDAIQRLRQQWASDVTTWGLWVTLESPSITEMAVGLGLDWVVIDAEHGHLDWQDILGHLRATVRSETVALVRVAELNGGLIKRALDLGADGVVVPWIETVEQLRDAVAYARYPVEGRRGIGAERATCWGECLVEHTADANQQVLVVPILETVSSMRNVARMCQVDGVDLFLFGPADFSATAGYRGQWEGPGVAEQILEAKQTIRRAGKQCGLLATSLENQKQRQQQGFRFIGLGLDSTLLLRSLHASLAAVGRDRTLQTSLVPRTTSTGPWTQLPAEFRPDRPEVMTAVGAGVVSEVARGITFECLVGTPHQARHLTTGLVTMAPGSILPLHTHPVFESITLLRGQASLEVEGRSYHLQRLDNVVIPPGLTHGGHNLSAREPALFHIAMPTETITREWVDRFFSRRTMPLNSTGVPGAERVTRASSAPRGTAGSRTEFIDYFNEDLIPGIDMSGGYGLFHPTGRLPAHIHDFDESICIVGGLATCVVEGRRYALRDAATALQPRGRVHYFINEHAEPMEMIWVYAGPRPERIVVDEAFATEAGNPWQ